MKADLSRYVDLQFLAVTTLVRNKEKLVKLFRGMTTDAMAFVRRSGIVFGFGIGAGPDGGVGAVQESWIMPHSASRGVHQRLHRAEHVVPPRTPAQVSSASSRSRDCCTPSGARSPATTPRSWPTICSPRRSCSNGIIKGPGADKLFALVAKEIDAAIDAQTGIATPVVALAVGTKRYRGLKDKVVALVLERLPTTLLDAQDYATEAIDLENTIVEKMNALTNEEYESILRPVFKDDEPLMIAVGAILGGLVGELQVQMIELFAH